MQTSLSISAPAVSPMSYHANATSTDNTGPNAIEAAAHAAAEAQSATNMANKLWPRAEVFDHGILQTSFRLSFVQLMETLRHLQELPKIRKNDWIDHATMCPTPASDKEAQAYWQIFITLKKTLLGGDEAS
eukprot:Platyproteum_vivax@DN10645_c0_g1_i1.p1